MLERVRDMTVSGCATHLLRKSFRRAKILPDVGRHVSTAVHHAVAVEHSLVVFRSPAPVRDVEGTSHVYLSDQSAQKGDENRGELHVILGWGRSW